MLNKSVYIHVGFAKAASSFIQKFFSSHGEIYYPDRIEIVRHMCCPEFEFNKKAAIKYFNEQLEMARGRVLVLSHERLLGNPHSGFYDCMSVADRIFSVHPSAKIILFVREQFSIIASCYKQYVRIGGTKTLTDYIFPILDYRLPLFNYKIFSYVKIILFFQKLFGKGNVFVLPVELLGRDPRSAIEDLQRFMGVTPIGYDSDFVNLGIPDSNVDILRKENLLSPPPSSLRDWDSIRPQIIAKHIHLKRNMSGSFVDQVKAIIGPDMFHESNITLSEILDIDLFSLGYS